MRIITLVICLSLFVCCQQPNLPKTGLEGKVLPYYSMLNSDSTTYFNMGTIPAGKPIVVLLFDPYCPYCRAETEDILKDMKSMQDVRFYFLTSSPFNDM